MSVSMVVRQASSWMGWSADEEKEKTAPACDGDRPSASQIQECHRRIDSYVKFALSKVPSSGGK